MSLARKASLRYMRRCLPSPWGRTAHYSEVPESKVQLLPQPPPWVSFCPGLLSIAVKNHCPSLRGQGRN